MSLSPSRNFTIGPDEDFSVPITPGSGFAQSPWKRSVLFEQSANLEKTKNPDPESFSKQALSLPAATQPNMARRASCPNFAIPDFNFVAPENKRLHSSKRLSIHVIVSEEFLSKFNSADTKLKAPPSPISEQPEISLISLEGQQNVVNQGTNLNSDKAVKVAEIQTVQKKSGFFASSVSSMFSANQVDNSNASFGQNNQTDGVVSAPVKKKSYLMRRASAISNADMNAMAPTSL